MGDDIAGIWVERLDEDACATVNEPRPDERLGVGEREQAGLDPYPAAYEVFAEFDDTLLLGRMLGRPHPLLQTLQAATS